VALYIYLKGEIGEGFGEVVGLHGVPVVKVLPLERVHLQRKCHHLDQRFKTSQKILAFCSKITSI
jgi:hypothetical protein